MPAMANQIPSKPALLEVSTLRLFAEKFHRPIRGFHRSLSQRLDSPVDEEISARLLFQSGVKQKHLGIPLKTHFTNQVCPACLACVQMLTE
jgi:hypothetical protein